MSIIIFESNFLSNGNWRESPKAVILYGMQSIENIISQRIRDILDSKGQNVSRLAEMTNRTTGYLSMLLNNKHGKRWNIDLLSEVAQALNVPMWHLFVDPKETISRDAYNVIDRYNRLDPDGKRIVDSILRAPPDESTSPQPKNHIKKG